MRFILSALVGCLFAFNSGAAFLVWDNPNDPGVVSEFRVFERTGSNDVLLTTTTEQTWRISLQPGPHNLSVRAVGVNGEWSEMSVSLVVPVLWPVTDLAVAASPYGTIIDWVDNRNLTEVSGYSIWRQTTLNSGVWEQIAQVNGKSWASVLPRGRSYIAIIAVPSDLTKYVESDRSAQLLVYVLNPPSNLKISP